MTLVEVMVAMAIFSIVLLVIGNLFAATGQVSNTVFQHSKVQQDAQRIMDSVTSLLSRTGQGGGGQLMHNGAPGGMVAWEISFRPMNMSAPIFDVANPSGSNLWLAQTWVLKFERTAVVAGRDGDPLGSGDQDNDFIVDDGRVQLYRRPVSGADILVSEIARDVRDFQVTAITPDVRPRMRFTLTLEKVMTEALRTPQDVAAARAGGGPRARHVVDRWVTLVN